MKTKDPVLRQYDGRCTQCYMRENYCICSLIPSIDNATFVTVIMHHRESYKTTNTARIACMALNNSRILLRGLKDNELDGNNQLTKIVENGATPILLTLHDDAKVLTKEFVSEQKTPLHLIVPDGNWRQASKMGKREKALHNITWVKLPPGPRSEYRLRREHHPEGLSTIEAIARALSIIESPSIEKSLLDVFDTMVERTLETRPKTSSPIK